MGQVTYAEPRVVRATCDRCGFEWHFPDRYLSRDYNTDLCPDCRAKPSVSVTKNGMTCKPWSGEFDFDNQVCLNRGKPYLVGRRACGHADCVNKSHITTEEGSHS